ncbi:MAG: response regulator [Leptospiraceae bacterium]|nr:response regulator [Leptospiraceae bacterium]MCB1303065.1 response regulator [Leptospiraceae bacterium]
MNVDFLQATPLDLVYIVAVLSFLSASSISVFFHNPRSRINQSWAVICLLAAVWSGFAFFILAARPHPNFLRPPMAMVVIGITVSFYYFCKYLIIDSLESGKWNRLLDLSQIIPALLLQLFFLGWIVFPEYYPSVDDVFFAKNKALRSKPDLHYYFYSLFFLYSFSISLFLLFRNFSRFEDRQDRIRIRTVFWSILIVSSSLLLNINFFNLIGIAPPVFSGSIMLVSSAAITYTILRHKAWRKEYLMAQIAKKKEELYLINRVLVKSRNIAEREAKDSQELAMQSLQRASEMKDEFLAAITHELRTPLNGIIGLAEHGMESSDSSSFEQLRSYELIIGTARRLSNLVNDILDYSQLKHKELPLRQESVAVADMCQHLLDLNAVLLTGRPVKLRLDIPRNLPDAYVDPARFEQILQNLIGNAIKFTSEGEIVVDAAFRPPLSDSHSAESANGAGTLVIRVQDTGIGIPPEDLERIFLSYEQSDASRAAGGAGLGLAISRRLALLQNGNLTVQSTPGKGTSFMLELPAASPATQSHKSLGWRPRHIQVQTTAMQPEGVVQNPDGRALIAVVDDSALNNMIVTRHLLAADYAVVAFSDGLTAIEWIGAREAPPDLMLLDIMMPKVSGIELCKMIRKDRTPMDLAIIMVSAKNQNLDLTTSLNAGANDYLVKPFQRDQLLHHVELVLTARKVHIEQKKQDQLEKAVARAERDRIYRDLHDHLGARLTDLGITIEKLDREVPEAATLYIEIKEKLKAAVHMLRERISSLEDLNELARDFFLGLQLVMVRRFHGAGRKIRFAMSGGLDDWLNKQSHREFNYQLYSICTEVANNDLKYGHGEARWSFRIENERLLFEVRTGSSYNLQQAGTGSGTGSIQNRTAQLGGTCHMELEESWFKLRISIPIVAKFARMPAPHQRNLG